MFLVTIGKGRFHIDLWWDKKTPIHPPRLISVTCFGQNFLSFAFSRPCVLGQPGCHLGEGGGRGHFYLGRVEVGKSFRERKKLGFEVKQIWWVPHDLGKMPHLFEVTQR
jgi:hypothetical protein